MLTLPKNPVYWLHKQKKDIKMNKTLLIGLLLLGVYLNLLALCFFIMLGDMNQKIHDKACLEAIAGHYEVLQPPQIGE